MTIQRHHVPMRAGGRMIPGEILLDDGDIELNAGRRTQTLVVANTGDRPIQVGSHYHFYEANDALQFHRQATLGMRLNIAAGTAVRFEPGQRRTVELVDLAGARAVYGFQGRVNGPLPDPPPMPMPMPDPMPNPMPDPTPGGA